MTVVTRNASKTGLPVSDHTLAWSWIAVVLIGFLPLAGCGSRHPATIVVTGTVRHNAAPLDAATIVFKTDHPKTGRPLIATGSTDGSGRFTLLSRFGPRDVGRGAAPGRHRVTISKFVPPSGMSSEAYQSLVDVYTKSIKEKGNALPSDTPPPMVQLLPPKYSDANAATLSADVVSGGKNEFVFDLE
jgi:hypothetical protein